MSKANINGGLTLVTGGTGKTGRRVADRLRAMNRPVRIGSRSAEPSFDWDDRSTWGPALQGVQSVYVTFQPDLGVQRALGRAPRDFSDYVRRTAATGVWSR